MPYIKSEDRYNIEYLLRNIRRAINNNEINTCGELNFMITTILHTFIEKQGCNYSNLNNVIGLLECIKQEYYRRIVADYEDKKIEENGDIYYKDEEFNGYNYKTKL
jgi:hypothetical protein